MNQPHTDTVTHDAAGLVGLHPLVALRSQDLIRTYDLIRDTAGRKVLTQRMKNLFPGATVDMDSQYVVRFKQQFQLNG